MAAKKKPHFTLDIPDLANGKLDIPDELGKSIDLAFELRAVRLEFEKQVDEVVSALKARYKEVEDHIINSFNKSDIEGAKGQLATAGINKTTVAQVEDWEKLWPWIAKQKAWDMVQRRINDKSYRDRLEEKQKIPGVVPYVVTKLSLTKR